MNELVYRKENQVLTNSRLVAMKFNKRHSNVIRDIEELLSKLPENERKLNFELLEEDVERCRPRIHSSLLPQNLCAGLAHQSVRTNSL